jgi:uncharacterized 2Fe-2S/4Fe-4S cluster protein (DUF4445 family)
MPRNKEKVNLVFQPSGRQGGVVPGLSILDAARSLGEEMETPCGGLQGCGKCKVRVAHGDYAQWEIESRVEHAGPRQAVEEELLAPEELASGFRLACVAAVQGDMVVHIPDESRRGRQVISKQARVNHFPAKPAIRTYRIDVSPSDLENPMADWERANQAMAAHGDLAGADWDLAALRDLPIALRRGNGRICLDVRMNREVIRARQNDQRRLLGLALDLGSTSMAVYLCDLNSGEIVATASGMNPQCKYGDDVVSRISYHQMNPGGLDEMRKAVVEAVNALADQTLAELNATVTGRDLSREDILDMTLCGNAVMQQIILGIDPEPLGVLPFTPVKRGSISIKARDIGIRINPGASVMVMPMPAGYVGGDIVAALVGQSEAMQDGPSLLVDIGTNGEVVLAHGGRLWCTSCATGPALEGAQISFGMRAAEGAIERVRIDPATLEVDYKVIGHPHWRSQWSTEAIRVRGICGSGIIEATAQLFLSDLIAANGAMRKTSPSKRLVINPQNGMPAFVLAWADETRLGKDLTISQKDVRQIQLAKAALNTGCHYLLQRIENDGTLQSVRIAGSFGAHIDHEMAMVLGMLPAIAAERIANVGNAAGEGCCAALLNTDMRRSCDRLAEEMQYIELTLEPDFAHQLAQATLLPSNK